MGLFGLSKKPDPKEQVRDMQRKMRGEIRGLTRQIHQIEREEDKVKRQIKEAAKKGDKDVCMILGKGIVRSRKAIAKMYSSIAQINGVNMAMTHQLATIRMAGSIKSSTEVMKQMQSLIKIPEISATMREMSREMTKVGIIEEMMEETFDSMDPEDLEEQAEVEIENVLWEITSGELGKAPLAKTDAIAADARYRSEADKIDMTFDSSYFEQVTADFSYPELGSVVGQCKAEASSISGNKDILLKLLFCTDLTTLAGDDTPARVRALVDKALHPCKTNADAKCGAVCVYPLRVKDVHDHLKRTGKQLHIASVAGGFPSGQYRIESRCLEIELAVADGADEIDTVINRGAAIDGDWRLVHDELAAMKAACGKAHLKTILATGELESLENVHKASWTAIMAGSDFIKTSTGKESVNATLEVAYVMCKVIDAYHKHTGKKIGFKPAGGIKTVEEACQFYLLVKKVLGEEWLNGDLFRIGASSLVDNLVKVL
uniref:Deoxyribose-phosphate aldolase n=1 Tax=Rhabditophanes sp. KR3021 TaxID=114890 RepID=A0AC35TNU1_9BILA